jgi:hypothetical protein
MLVTHRSNIRPRATPTSSRATARPTPTAAVISLLVLAVLIVVFIIYGGFNFWRCFGGPANVNVTTYS